MGSVGKIMGYGLSLGLALNAIGLLPKATYWIARQLAASGPPQLVSLTALNRALISGGTHHRRGHTQKGKHHD